jgi:butyryl-CoA dehydrogenase
MDFELTEEQQLIQAMAREFAQTKVAPIAAEIDLNHRFPSELLPELRELNLLGIPFSEEYGGAGADSVSYILVIEELAKVCASTAIILSTHTSLCAWPIHKFGNEMQKKEYLAKLAAGEWLGAFGLTEPSAGTDAGSMKTTAVLEGDQWVLNGSKCFITNGAYADVFVIFALTEPAQATRGISAFIVEKGTPGFSCGAEEKKMGIKASSTTPLYFSNCRIPREALLGKENKGFPIAMATLDVGRIGVAAQAVGIAQGALDAAVAYAKERIQFGKPIATHEAIQWMIADCATQVEAARLLVYRAAWNKDNGLPYSAEASMAKLFASETASRVAGKAIQIHGGYGFTESYSVERSYRDAKITELYEGTSEVQRMVISRSLLH